LVLIPGDDPPFVTFALHDGTRNIRLTLRDGRELMRRLDSVAEHRDLRGRILGARQAPPPKVFVVEPADEAVLLAVLDDPPVSDRLAEIREALGS
jgi:hypothetical protein